MFLDKYVESWVNKRVCIPQNNAVYLNSIRTQFKSLSRLIIILDPTSSSSSTGSEKFKSIKT